MQRNDLALKRKILYDGEEIPGLVETSDLMDEEVGVEVPGFNRTVEIGSGVKKFQPLDLVYKQQKDTATKKFFADYYFNREVKDVVIVNTDATGAEVDRWLLPDCECRRFSERAYNAGGVEFFGISIQVVCTGTPTRLDP